MTIYSRFKRTVYTCMTWYKFSCRIRRKIYILFFIFFKDDCTWWHLVCVVNGDVYIIYDQPITVVYKVTLENKSNGKKTNKNTTSPINVLSPGSFSYSESVRVYMYIMWCVVYWFTAGDASGKCSFDSTSKQPTL
jgi:hypothetical protein